MSSLSLATPWNVVSLPDTPLFGTDGVRGHVGELLTAPLAMQLGFWAGHILKTQVPHTGPIIIGQDSRNSSDMLVMALAGGFTAAGLEVWNLGLCPTAGVAHLTRMTEAIGGVMVSASHNPPEDNGIKFFDAAGTKLSPYLQAQIEAAMRGQMPEALSTLTLPNQWGRHYHRSELVAQYTDSLYRPLLPSTLGKPVLQGMRIVLDLAWGAAVNIAPSVFRGLGAEVICLHDRPDGDRINVNCGSTHLQTLQETVIAHGADLGFAFDGDADRALAVDAKGRAVNGDYILYFWGQHLRQSQQLPGDTIISTVMANLGFERAWQQQGGTLVRTAVGDQHVFAAMVAQGAMLGGEQSGHILCHHYSITGDGILTALHLAALVQHWDQSLAEMVDTSFQTYPQRLQNVRVVDRQRRLNWQQCEAVQRTIAQAEADMGDRGRVLVRASGTEPLIRVMVEAAEVSLVNHWTDRLASVVEAHLAA
ncbi:phosphoglucosamine mutase [Trichothermofontia sp.]